MITVADARNAANAWLEDTASRMAGYQAAFIAGSMTALPDDARVQPWSDTDVMVVLDGETPQKAGKFLRDGVLLEGTYLSRDSLADPEAVLGSYHVANAMATAQIIDDPSGWLAGIQAAVQQEFPRRGRVEARCRMARDTVASGFGSFHEAESLALRAQGWVFPTGVMTHILLLAGLQNPTVRRRYETVRSPLEDYDQLALYEELLDVLGCREMTASQVSRHLDAISGLFDVAAPVTAPAYRFASDITPISRPISIDGSRDLIDRGLHREAVFWLVVTGSRALQKLAHGSGPEVAGAHEGPLRDLLADLGIDTTDDFLDRRDQALDLLPMVDIAANDVMDRNLEIRD